MISKRKCIGTQGHKIFEQTRITFNNEIKADYVGCVIPSTIDYSMSSSCTRQKYNVDHYLILVHHTEFNFTLNV